MKHTSLGANKKSQRFEQLSDLVKSCAFSLKNWEEVLAHPFFSLEDSGAQVVPQTVSESFEPDAQEAGPSADLLNMVPLQVSAILPVNPHETGEAIEESKEA